jgi:hypothetical protein
MTQAMGGLAAVVTAGRLAPKRSGGSRKGCVRGPAAMPTALLRPGPLEAVHRTLTVFRTDARKLLLCEVQVSP